MKDAMTQTHLERTPSTIHRLQGAEVPKVFVITLNWNGREWISECLQSLFALEYPNAEVVFVDNGSTDGSVEYVRRAFPHAHVLTNEHNLGYSAGFNVGLAYAAARGADYFLIVNNDTRMDRRALDELVAVAMQQASAGFVTGKVYYSDRPTVFQTVGKESDPVLVNGRHIGAGEEDLGQYDEISERPFGDDVFTLVSGELYRALGGYDPGLFLQAEEFDWQVRARRAGWKIYYAPGARIWHHGSMSMGGLGGPTSEYFYVRNQLVVVGRYFGLVKFTRCLVGMCAPRLRNAIAAAFGWRGRDWRAPLAGLLGGLSGTLWLLHRRGATKVPRVIAKLQGSAAEGAGSNGG